MTSIVTSIIASFKVDSQNCTTHTLSKTGDGYKHERLWFNTYKPTEKKVEIYISEDFDTVAKSFLIGANVSLDTTKDYNVNVTDEQRFEIRDAINDVREYGKYLEGRP